MRIFDKAPVLGIDLGTVTSMACVVEPGKPEPTVIKPHPGSTWQYDWMPSVFCSTDKGILVGRPALNQLGDPRYKRNVVRCVKRYMGERGDNGESKKLFPRHDVQFSPVDVSGHILRHFRLAAEKQLGLPEGAITEAVVTVPAYFGQMERYNTRLAAGQAGFDFDKVRLLDEPVAAAFGLKLHEKSVEQLALVIDLGGGTLDVTLLRVGRTVEKCGFQELGRDGYGKLGGIEWDRKLAEMVVFQHEDLDLKRRGFEYFLPENFWLYDAAETAKIQFCTNPDSPQLHQLLVTYWDDLDQRNIDSVVRRSHFFEETQELADQCGDVADRVLREVSEADLAQVNVKRPLFFLPRPRLKKLEWKHIDHIYMVGGGSLNPGVQKVIAGRWGRPVDDLTVAHRPQHQVAFGAARCAATLSQRDSLFEGTPLRSPHTIGYYYYPEGKHGPKLFEPVIRRNERILERHGERFHCPVGGDGATLTVELAEEQLDPTSDQATPKRMGVIRLTDLPPRKPGQAAEKVEFELLCHSERQMEIIAHFRGRQKKVPLNGEQSFGNGHA
jgi:molecular chaperone DnaK